MPDNTDIEWCEEACVPKGQCVECSGDGSEDVEVELDQLNATIQRHNAHQARLNKYYDEAPDGSFQKQDALKQMKQVGEKLRVAWARVDEILEAHPEI